MGRFQPLYLRRSDGMLDTTTKHGGRITKEANKPTPKQLDDKPKADGVKDYYREVGINEPKHMDWRRKLAAMLARGLNLDVDKGYILAHFPENYRLFEHVKTAKKGEGETKTKTHAGGGNERQDAYLYGHPLGRKKRFRSPGDFYPHLFWLATDPAGDSDNCGCKICCPEELDEPVKPAQPAQPAITRRPSNPTKPSNTPTPAPPTPAPAAPALAQRAALANPQPSPSLAPVAAAQSSARTPSKPIDYDIDRQYAIFLFRQGEMVWFDRSGAWGLGVILERSKVGNQSHYRIQQLSYPGHSPPPVEITRDLDLRPWLAWTVPPFTHKALNEYPARLHYSTFQFEDLLSGKYGSGTPEIDASILAAKAIDASYTPFAPESRSGTQAYVEIRWSGIYLGAEKIWVNEPVRYVNPADQVATHVLVVRAIVERSSKSAQPWSTLSLVGDVYVMLPVEPISMNQAPGGIVPGSDTTNLPTRILEDTRRRNIFSIQVRGIAHYWKRIERSKVVDLKDVRGRWYECTLFLPILLPGQAAEYEQQAREGDVKEVLSMMNGHGDCNVKDGTRQLPARAQKREAAFGKAVPPHTRIIDGVRQSQPQQRQQQAHQQQQAQHQQQQQQAQHQQQQQQQRVGSVMPPQTQPQARPDPGTAFQSHAAASGNASTSLSSTTAPQEVNGFEEFMDLDGLAFDQSFV